MPITEIHTQNDWDGLIGQSGFVILDFWGPECPHCQRMMPEVVKLAKTYPVGKVNIAKHPEIFQHFKVDTMPTVMVLRGGQVLAQWIGLSTAKEIETWIAAQGAIEHGHSLVAAV